MENLKAIIVFLLFWSIVIWCARIIKRKRDKQMMEFSEELPEMELVTDRVGVYTILFVELFMHPIHIFLYDVGV